MAIIDDTSKHQLNLLLETSFDELNEYLLIIQNSLKDNVDIFRKINEKANEKDLSNKVDEINSIFSSLLNIARFYTNDSYQALFKTELKEHNFNDEKLYKIEKVVEIMKKNNLINELVNYYNKSTLEGLVLPRLESFNLTYNYRVLDTIEGEKKLIPIIQCILRTINPDRDLSQAFSFQFVPFELDILIENLKKFRSSLKKSDEQILIN